MTSLTRVSAPPDPFVQGIVEGEPEATRTLLEIARDVWESSFLGASVGEGLGAVFVMALAIVLRGLFARFILAVAQRQAKRTDTAVDDKILDAIAQPIKLIPIIIGLYIAVLILGLDGPDGEGPGISAVETLIVIAIFWALHNAVDPFAYFFTPLQKALGPVLIEWLAKMLRIAFMVIGAAAVLQVWGIPVAPLVAGFGLVGVAIGLGAQDLVRNLIAGLLILTEKRFLPGDWIAVDGVVEGTVEQINFRSTLVRRFDKGPVYVPNAYLADNAVTNFSRMTHRRIKWAIGVEYKTTTEQLHYIRDNVLDFILGHPEFAKPPEVATFMRVDSFGASSIDFLLYCFTKTTNWGEWLRLKEELAFRVKKVVEDEAKTAFAFPSTSVYIDYGTEIFLPPESRARQVSRTASLSGPQSDSQARGEFIGDDDEGAR